MKNAKYTGKNDLMMCAITGRRMIWTWIKE
jgi:hypothetical protein